MGETNFETSESSDNQARTSLGDNSANLMDEVNAEDWKMKSAEPGNSGTYLEERGVIPQFNGFEDEHPSNSKDESISTQKVGETTVTRDSSGNFIAFNNNGRTLALHEDGDWYMHNDDGGEYIQAEKDSITLNTNGEVNYEVSDWGFIGWHDDRTLGSVDDIYVSPVWGI